MKTHKLKLLSILIYSLISYVTPAIVFADCNRRVYEEPPKMEWYMNDCGLWRQAYPGEDPYDDRPVTNYTQQNYYPGYVSK